MDAPPVQYVRTSDGYDIAYCVSGDGPPLVLFPWGMIDIRFAWHAAGDWLSGLRDRFRLVQYDARGRGLSTRALSSGFTYLDYNHDLEAVVENLALKDFSLFANGGFGHTAIRYAASHPERVRALIVGDCPVSLSAFPRSLMDGLAAENWDLFIHSLIPPAQSPEEYKVWFENMRGCSTYDDWRIVNAAIPSDVSADLAQIRVPTLVLHSRRFLLVAPGEVNRLAAGVQDARLIPLEGELLQGDAKEGLSAIDAFLSSLDRRQPPVTKSLPAGLSAREVEVLRLLAAGKSNQQIADELVISLNTVRRHVSNIFDKTGVANRAQAAVYANEHGIA